MLFLFHFQILGVLHFVFLLESLLCFHTNYLIIVLLKHILHILSLRYIVAWMTDILYSIQWPSSSKLNVWWVKIVNCVQIKVTSRGFEPCNLYIAIFTWYASRTITPHYLTCIHYYRLYNFNWLNSHFDQTNN